ncbi:MAG: metallo-mystery pair system four-Cys motif protein [Gemmatimonadetes bacterium]|nr:metallo-mystery pair system four-Cys motif protein [Gemmatimonadota bacterium]
MDARCRGRGGHGRFRLPAGPTPVRARPRGPGSPGDASVCRGGGIATLCLRAELRQRGAVALTDHPHRLPLLCAGGAAGGRQRPGGAGGARRGRALAAGGGGAARLREDGTGPCRNGTPATRLTITGRVPAGDYRGLRFTVGVPWALNHLDLTRQAPPLDLTAMFWTWASGYTFLRLDLSTDGPVNRLFLHLGSSGCVRGDGDTDAKLPPDRCAQPNRPDVAVEGFDPARDTVLVDLAALLAESRLDTNQANTAKGCMSGPDDQDCDPMFAALGLPFGDRSGGPQRVFPPVAVRW